MRAVATRKRPRLVDRTNEPSAEDGRGENGAEGEDDADDEEEEEEEEADGVSDEVAAPVDLPSYVVSL